MNPDFYIISFHIQFASSKAHLTNSGVGRSQPMGVPLLSLSLRWPRVGASSQRTAGALRLPNERGLDDSTAPGLPPSQTHNSSASGHWLESGDSCVPECTHSAVSEPSDAEVRAGGLAGGRAVDAVSGSVL